MASRINKRLAIRKKPDGSRPAFVTLRYNRPQKLNSADSSSVRGDAFVMYVPCWSQ